MYSNNILLCEIFINQFFLQFVTFFIPFLYNSFFSSPQQSLSVVYANYGRDEDFRYLDEHNITVNNSIVFIRYGEVFRGDKVTSFLTWKERYYL